MATESPGVIASGDGSYRLGFSSKLYAERVVMNPIVKTLTENGCINIENDLSKSGGGTVTMYNQLRLGGKGSTGDVDVYSTAILSDKASRSFVIAKNSQSIQWPLKGTQSQQYSPYDIGEHNKVLLGDWAEAIVSSSLINQAAGNTATSITVLAADETAFTGSDLTRVTGNNAAAVPTYHYEASLGGVITTDSGINSGNPLTIADFQLAAEIVTSQQSGKPTWQTIKNKPYLGVALMSMTALNQLTRDPVTAGQGFQLSQIYNAMLAGGKTMDLQQFQLPGVPFLLVVCPDSAIPRGVTLSSGAETANTRRVVILGSNAIDMAFGAGFTPQGGNPIPGINVEFDLEYKKLNKQGFGTASVLWGCKKAQSTGPGTGSSTAYDVASYVIGHYSAS